MNFKLFTKVTNLCNEFSSKSRLLSDLNVYNSFFHFPCSAATPDLERICIDVGEFPLSGDVMVGFN